MWRYLFLAMSVAGAAMTYPALFQEKADEIVAQREPGVEAPCAAKVTEVGREERGNGRIARIEADTRGHFVVEAKLNGRKAEVLVDTGATLVAINESVARRIGIKLTREDFRYKVSTANGDTKAAAVVIDEIAIGKIRVRDVQATVLSDKALDGILLGMSFLKQLDRFEVSDGTLVLTQ